MKKYLLSILLTVSVPVMASPINIIDAYYGGDDHGYGDVIGDAGKFGISSMDVSLVGNWLSVTINTPFASTGLGSFTGLTPNGKGIGFGDLFLSSDGWAPAGSAPYLSDDHSNGEVWEYGISLSDRWSTTSSSSLYSLSGSNNDSALLSEDFLNSGIFRDGQEVAVDTASLTTTALANLTSFSNDASSITFGLDVSGTSLLGASSIGIHWGMTCGNDTIEGAYNVPEPATIVLMLLGIAFIFGVAQRRRLPATSTIS